MFVVPLLATIWFAVPPKPQPKFTEAQRRELAGIIATMNAVENRLQLEMVNHDPLFESHAATVTKILGSLNELGLSRPWAMRGCWPNCNGPAGCVPCENPLANQISAMIGLIKSDLMGSWPEPSFLANENKVLDQMANMAKAFKTPLKADGYCPERGILMPCK